MRIFQLLILLSTLLTINLHAQAPANDECNNAINLGTAPICDRDALFINVDATTSNVVAPDCFNGAQRDVWFTFRTAANIRDYVITVRGEDGADGTAALTNPQATLYRGSCAGPSELVCVSAENGSNELRLRASNLLTNVTYTLRINDFSATATPNSGFFTVCVEEFIPAIIMGETANTNACSGTVLDSGGEDGNYGNFENSTLTICPQTPNSCIVFDVVDYQMELGFDILSFFAGDDIEAPLLARVSGSNFGQPFQIQASSDCVTLQFVSDVSTTQSGFEVNWECRTNCRPTSIDRLTVVNNLPFNGSFNSCDVPATFAETACGEDVFLNGPEKVFIYNSPGDLCANITIENAEPNTGVLVLDRSPLDPDAVCIAESETGFIQSADFQTAGDYYIVVSQPFNCVNFDISIEERACILSPALLNALCNPLNGCVEQDAGVPSSFTFQDGFQDVTLEERTNSGCWQNEGIEADFFWFSIEAQADGKFGFILESADEPSDIDFNVWGPFTADQACNDKQAIVDVIESEQPIRSSWAPTAGPTGLADVHPVFRTQVRDEFDCFTPFIPSFLGDDFVRPIDAQEGEVYVVLINDFGNDIEGNNILVDWSPSDRAVLDKLSIEVSAEDTEICLGESTQLQLSEGIDNVEWSPANTLSCDDCLTPIASPTETTIYKAIVKGVCTTDTLQIQVDVLGVELSQDVTVCAGEMFELQAGGDFESATYEWIAPDGIELSCTDCPNPTVTAATPGVYTITVNLDAGECPATDQITLTVLAAEAPTFKVAPDQGICEGDSDIELGDPNNDPTLSYDWTSVPEGFTSTNFNPTVSPTETTTYFVEVSNGICPISSIDSVTITVDARPIFSLIDERNFCQGDSIILSESTPEDGVTYLYEGPTEGDFVDATDLNTVVVPTRSGTYELTATRGGCEVTESVELDVTEIGIDLLISVDGAEAMTDDTVRICRGSEIIFTPDEEATLPSGVDIRWTSSDDNFQDTLLTSLTVMPDRNVNFIATVENMGCIRMDTVVVVVDSLPDLAIMPSDTMICEGNFVILTSETYEPFDYPNIEFMWTPAAGQQTGDSLFNLVVAPDTTIIYTRTTMSGACISMDSARVEVNPLPEIQIIPMNPTICSGESVQLSVEQLNDVPIESYMWEPATGLSCSDCPNPIATMEGTFNVQVMSDKMCPGGAVVFIQAGESPALALEVDQTLCPGGSVQLNSVFTPGATYTWESNDPLFTDTDNPTPTVSPTAGTFTYTVTASNGECPDVTGSVVITVIDIESAELTLVVGDEAGCIGEPFTATATATELGEFRWSNGVTESNVMMSTVEYIENDSIAEVSVTFVVGPDCVTLEESEEISLFSSEVGVPNAFTPNDDDTNDEFRLFYADERAIDFVEMQIFDRWGNLVFETNTIGVGWNGQRNNDGGDLPSDVYAYSIKYVENCGEREEIVLTGKVVLLR
ncbi:MAG: gliding motility-associated C-terminal domain-containing protein [Bacteroidota bacterium]